MEAPKETYLQLYLLKSNDDFPLEKTLCLKIPVFFCGAVLRLFLQCSSQPLLPCLAGRTECQPEKSQTGLGMVSKIVSSNYFVNSCLHNCLNNCPNYPNACDQGRQGLQKAKQRRATNSIIFNVHDHDSGFNPTYKHGDDWGMVKIIIVLPTL